MHGRRRDTSFTQTLNGWFRGHPLLFPLILIIVGGGLLVAQLVALQAGGYAPVYGIGLTAIMLILGLLLLPLGLMTRLRRQRNAVVLKCPHCQTESRAAPTPFTVERVPGVPYSYVVCSQCGGDFTVDRHARLE